MKSTQEKIIFNILIKRMVILVLIPVLTVSGFIMYSKMSSEVRYVSNSSVLINSSKEIDIDFLDMYIKLTNTISEIGKSSIVIDEVYNQLDNGMTKSEIIDSLTIKANTNSQIINISSETSKKEDAVNISRLTSETMKRQVESLYGEDMLSIVDLPSEENISVLKMGVSKLGIIFVGASSLIITLMIVLAIDLRKYKIKI